MFEHHFNFVVPSALAKQLYETKNKIKKRNDKLVEKKKRWSNLKDEVEKMSKDEKETEQPNKILKSLKEILNFNKETQKQGLSLKILTPDQILSRLTISLRQLNAGNNPEKLKNEIRQLLYSSYRPKKLTKNSYKSLINIV